MDHDKSDKKPNISVREESITAMRNVADAVRTSLGLKGIHKMDPHSVSRGELIIDNGATLLEQMEIFHPAARMLVGLSRAQEVEAGDGTTSVTIIAGALLSEAQRLLNRCIHPSIIADGFMQACEEAVEVLRKSAIPVDLSDTETLLNIARSSLGSKLVAQYYSLLAPMAVEAVMNVIDPETTGTLLDFRNIRVVKVQGGTIDESQLINGIVFKQKESESVGGPTTVENAKIGLIQFQLCSPNIEYKTVITDYREFQEERTYIFNLCKKIRDTGCNVVLIQKSILGDATNDLSLQFLAEMKIMVIEDIERSEIEFISEKTGAIPVARIEEFNESKLGSAELVESISTSGGTVVTMTGIPNTVSILVRGSNDLILDEAERSIHDTLCVIRSVVKEKFLIPGGGSPEIEASIRLTKISNTKKGLLSIIYCHFATALEVIPYTLAENAGLHPIEIVTELKKKHNEGEAHSGISLREGQITDMLEEKVTQPLLVTLSALRLATQTVNSFLDIDSPVLPR